MVEYRNQLVMNLVLFKIFVVNGFYHAYLKELYK